MGCAPKHKSSYAQLPTSWNLTYMCMYKEMSFFEAHADSAKNNSAGEHVRLIAVVWYGDSHLRPGHDGKCDSHSHLHTHAARGMPPWLFPQVVGSFCGCPRYSTPGIWGHIGILVHIPGQTKETRICVSGLREQDAPSSFCPFSSFPAEGRTVRCN